MIARPDAGMVEVPLEIEAALPRDFEGAAVLSSSGLPRKVRLKAQRDALKLSTAYRADQLMADLVKTALRGSPIDVEKVQLAARNFVRSVRERRQDGATLTVESNGRGKIEVSESLPLPPTPAASTPPDGSRSASWERRRRASRSISAPLPRKRPPASKRYSACTRRSTCTRRPTFPSPNGWSRDSWKVLPRRMPPARWNGRRSRSCAPRAAKARSFARGSLGPPRCARGS